MSDPFDLISRADLYCQRNDLIRFEATLGKGKDGTVWATNRASVIKIHVRPESYRDEMAAYIRIESIALRSIAGFAIPALIDFDDELRAIEMQIVTPPFIVDFASARLDFDPHLIEDEGNTLEDFVRSRFDDRTDTVMGIYHELIGNAGIYLTDLHPQNIKFA